MSLEAQRRPAHLPALDALRGIAALLVVFHHCAFVVVDTGKAHGPILLLAQQLQHVGHPAVILFFVLSGFVLQLSAEREPLQPYSSYIIRRGFRLLPAMFTSLTLAALLPFPVADGLGPWLKAIVAWDRNLEVWVRNALLLMTRPSDAAYDLVLWSLAYELRFSVIFPFLSIFLKRFPFTYGLVAIALYISTSIGLHALLFAEPF